MRCHTYCKATIRSPIQKYCDGDVLGEVVSSKGAPTDDKEKGCEDRSRVHWACRGGDNREEDGRSEGNAGGQGVRNHR